MSLKAFHVFFITLVTLFSAAFTLWAVGQVMAGAGGYHGPFAVIGLLLSIALPVYGAWFLKKTKGVSFV